jgi:hypothetical protein
MHWYDEKQMLVTCAKDKSIKVWQFPEVWIDESGVEPANPLDEEQISPKKTSGPPSSNLNTFPSTLTDEKHYDSMKAEQMRQDDSGHSDSSVESLDGIERERPPAVA